MHLDLPATKLQAVRSKMEEAVEHSPSTPHPKINHEAFPQTMMLFHLILHVIHPEVVSQHGEEATARVVGRGLLSMLEDKFFAEAVLVLIQHIVCSR